MPTERNFDGEKIRLQHRMYTRTHEIKQGKHTTDNRNPKRRIRFQHECVYDYFMMIIFGPKIALIFTMFHFHAEQFNALAIFN